MTEFVDISLRQGPWAGLGDSTALLPGTATWRRLDGCYISKDGTEIRRLPGRKRCGEPFVGEAFAITGGFTGATTRVNLDVSDRPFASTNVATNGACYVKGNATIPDGYYVYTVFDSDSVDISVNTSGTLDTEGRVIFDREESIHQITHCDGRVVVLAETITYHGVGGSDPRKNVAAVVSAGPCSFDSPETPSYAQIPETGFVFWQSPSMTSALGGPLSDWGWHIDVLRRMQCDTLNGRTLVAVPGLGCMMEANLRAGPPPGPAARSPADARPPLAQDARRPARALAGGHERQRRCRQQLRQWRRDAVRDRLLRLLHRRGRAAVR